MERHRLLELLEAARATVDDKAVAAVTLAGARATEAIEFHATVGAMQNTAAPTTPAPLPPPPSGAFAGVGGAGAAGPAAAAAGSDSTPSPRVAPLLESREHLEGTILAATDVTDSRAACFSDQVRS